MRKPEKKPIWGVVSGLSGLGLTAWMIWSWAPDQWWKELTVIVIGLASSFLLVSWLSGRKKWGIILTIFIFGFLILNRLEILDILTVILLIAVLGLISLID